MLRVPFISLLMLATLFLPGTLAGTDFYVFLLLLLLLLLLLGLLLGFFRRFVRTGQPTHSVPPAPPHQAPPIANSWGERPEPEIITATEYKAQKHRLLHS